MLSLINYGLLVILTFAAALSHYHFATWRPGHPAADLAFVLLLVCIALWPVAIYHLWCTLDYDDID